MLSRMYSNLNLICFATSNAEAVEIIHSQEHFVAAFHFKLSACIQGVILHPALLMQHL